jgi:hypothetical protein
VLPWWLERQVDPESPAYTAGLYAERNLVGHSWTRLGALDGKGWALTDPRGLVSLGSGRGSLDWWVRTADGWVFPSRQATVRQHLLEDAPVVVTRIRVAGGEIEHRVAVARPLHGGMDAAIVEIENRTATPVAIALAVRPYDVVGVSRVAEIAYSGDHCTVDLDGWPSIRFPRPPGHIVAATGADGDVAAFLDQPRSGPSTLERPLSCADGLAQAAFVFPVVHGSALRVVVAPPEPPASGRRRRRRRRSGELPDPEAMATTLQVAMGWRTHASRGARWLLPAGPLASAVHSARCQILLADRAAPWPGRGLSLGALDLLGLFEEVRPTLAMLPELQSPDGSLLVDDGERVTDVTGPAIAALGQHWRLTRDRRLVTDLSSAVAGAADSIERNRRIAAAADPPHQGLVRTGGAEEVFVANGWLLRALTDAGALLAAAQEGSAATAARRAAAELRVDLVSGMERARTGAAGPVPPGPVVQVDERLIEIAQLVWPIGVLPGNHPLVAGTLDVVRANSIHAGAYHAARSPRGWHSLRTIVLGMAELSAGDRRALDRLRWLVEVAAPNGVWPSIVHPRLRTGVAGGHDPFVTAAFLSMVRHLLVTERTEAGNSLALLTCLPPEWAGQGIEVHDAPTASGRLSYAVRWHDDRPALLWELRPHPGGPGRVTLTAPGLDPRWSSTSAQGEALLAAWPPRGGETAGSSDAGDEPSGPTTSPSGDHRKDPALGPDGSFS